MRKTPSPGVYSLFEVWNPIRRSSLRPHEFFKGVRLETANLPSPQITHVDIGLADDIDH